MNERFEITSLESLRFDGEPEREVVFETKEKLMKLHGQLVPVASIKRRVWIAATFLVALGMGAYAAPLVLEWWEHLTVVTDQELPDGRHHIVIEDDTGATVFDETIGADELLLQTEPAPGEDAGLILRVQPLGPAEGGSLQDTPHGGANPH